MFPIYMYVKEYKGLKDFEITFDNNYEIKYNREKDTLSISKKCKSTNNNIENFYSIDKIKGNIDSINLLIGKNGSGKTSILKVLSFSHFFYWGTYKNNRYNIILYKSSVDDKDFVIEIHSEYGIKRTKIIKIKNQELRIENELNKDYQNNEHYTKNIAVVRFLYEEKKMSADVRQSRFTQEYGGKAENIICKLNIGLENGSKEKIYNYLIKINKEKNNHNFENTYLTLLIPDLYKKLKNLNKEKIITDLKLNDNIDKFIMLYDINKNNDNIKDIILKNYFNYLYLEKVLRDLNKKIFSKKELEREKNEIRKLLSNKTISKKFKILLEKIEQFEYDWINYDEQKYKIVEEIATFVKKVEREEIDTQDDEIIKKFKMNCKDKNKEIIELLKKYDSFHIPNMKEVEETIASLPYYISSPSIKRIEFVEIEEEGLSAGEKIKLQYFSTLHGVLNGEFKDKEYITLLFDEVETYLHPEWSRRFLYELIEELKRYEDKKFKLIFATHSPFLIADVLAKDCIYLSKNKKGKIKAEIKEDVKTFGANIIDLFKNTMFLESTFGKFATEKIKGVVGKIEKAEKYSDIKSEVDFIIDEIGEKLISNKLKSIIKSKFENKDEEKDEEYYRKKIEEYQAKLDELEKKENNRNSKK